MSPVICTEPIGRLDVRWGALNVPVMSPGFTIAPVPFTVRPDPSVQPFQPAGARCRVAPTVISETMGVTKASSVARVSSMCTPVRGSAVLVVAAQPN